MGYTEFSNYITKLSNKFKIKDEESKVEQRRKKLLIKKGHNVHSLDNYETGLKSNEQMGCVYHRNDITNINENNVTVRY